MLPIDNPTNKFVRSPINAELYPTAARELSPAKCPTTTISAAVNNSYSTLEHISVTVNMSIFLNIGPLHMSIV